MTSKRWILVCLATSLGCVGGDLDDESGDGENDPFLVDGKAEIAGIEDGSADACGVLRFATAADFDTLDDDAKLDKRAARNIVAYREGADGTAGTADDRRFHSLAELDAVKYVGVKTFERLLDYVIDHDLVCESVDLSFITVSDWHGQLDPVAVMGVGNVGGAAALSTIFANERAANPNTLVMTAGDAFGATPPLASFFEERPAVLAMNAMRFDADGLGNHNFDRGVEHVEEMLDLARHPFLAANLTDVDSNISCPSKPDGRCVEPYLMFKREGVKIAVIGLINPDAQDLVKPGSFGSIAVTDPVIAALEARDAARADGAQVFVVITHMGATHQVGTEPAGPLIDLANRLEGIDVVFGDHTNFQVNMTSALGALVVENKSQGMTYARVRVTWDFASSSIGGRTAEILTPLADAVPADPAVVEALAPFRTQLAAAMDGTIATSSGVFERGSNVERLREVALGNLVADSCRVRYGTQLAFVNGGGLRAPIPSSYAPLDHSLRRPADGYAAGPPYDVVVGDAYAVLPFGNSVVTRTITGAQLWAMLEHSVGALPAANGRFGQISGFRFEFDSSRAAGARVVSVTLDDGTAIANDLATYTLATSDFLSTGGDGYVMLADGQGVSRDKMADVLTEHIRTLSTLTPAVDGRIRDLAPTP